MQFFLIRVKVLEKVDWLICYRFDEYALIDDRNALKKISPDESGEKYVDGLVSTGKINSLHNINNIFF